MFGSSFIYCNCFCFYFTYDILTVVINLQIKITNKIEEKVNEYQERTGATKTWICKKLNISTQNLYKLFTSTNLTLETLIKISYILQCEIIDLFEYEVSE